ncbi:hypothetical protein [Pseudomonas sp. LRF_L74]|uniref:hypothetical protein n=1 Tax=Pseudomonas sp. LRF_L74 TaxID=3369422 RepID=UPI003F5EC65C
MNENVWHMFELQLKTDGKLGWYLRRDDEGRGGFGPITYRDYEPAVAEARATNIQLANAVDGLGLPALQRESLRLKVQKALSAEERRLSEERLMLAEAIKRHAGDTRPRLEDLTIIGYTVADVRPELQAYLQRYPYVQFALAGHWVFQREGEHTWKAYTSYTGKAGLYCGRERIARGFGFSGTDHWGKTKAAIRDELLPRANKLLHLASVKRLLADALHRGQRVLIVGGFVFWYEDGKVPQWVVKQVGAAGSAADGEALWWEGTILSKNHGRIVVLPYIKESGEKVQGHTKNAPHDGKALPRHPDDYVELPFEVLDGDLMYGLFGELNYE